MSEKRALYNFAIKDLIKLFRDARNHLMQFYIRGGGPPPARTVEQTIKLISIKKLNT